ncbi:MAG: 1-acyl-sn-glycerol-3-phosphate acyltransferase [Bdellovibrionaceae bacterium]|nr:1-acyl-sn-glycerol-3-phosphate acyltransferase [Pseudobdellovibrionaceae bacterium]
MSLQAFLKISVIFFLIFVFLVISGLMRLFYFDHYKLQKARTRWQSRLCRLGLKVLNVKVESRHKDKGDDVARLMVGNHMSYLDVLILSALYPTSFVTSQEIRETPGLGFLCEWAGCLFVERRNRENLSKEVSDITQALQAGQTVTIFPEATSTNGVEILRFRTPLFQASVDAGVQVQSFCLNYVEIDGKPFSERNRDFVCWYGDMDFLPHLWSLCRRTQVLAEVSFLNPISPLNCSDKKILAETTQAQVTERFRGVMQTI